MQALSVFCFYFCSKTNGLWHSIIIKCTVEKTVLLSLSPVCKMSKAHLQICAFGPKFATPEEFLCLPKPRIFCKERYIIALPISLRIYLLSKFTHAVASYAFARASFRVAPVAVTPNTRPPLVTTLPSASNFEPA